MIAASETAGEGQRLKSTELFVGKDKKNGCGFPVLPRFWWTIDFTDLRNSRTKNHSSVEKTHPKSRIFGPSKLPGTTPSESEPREKFTKKRPVSSTQRFARFAEG